MKERTAGKRLHCVRVCTCVCVCVCVCEGGGGGGGGCSLQSLDWTGGLDWWTGLVNWTKNHFYAL